MTSWAYAEKCLPKMAQRGTIVDDAVIRGWCKTVTRSVKRLKRHETRFHYSLNQLNAHWAVGLNHPICPGPGFLIPPV
jgi:hypothetical protein